MSMNLAAQLYTLRDFCKTPTDIESTFKKVKAIGYNAVQVSGIGPIDPNELKNIAQAAGLEIVATHTGYDRYVSDLEGVIADHKLWGCSYAGIGSMPGQYRGSAEGYKSFAEEFNEIGKKLQAHGIKFVYHNHRFEFERFNGKTGMEIMLENTQPENFGFILDTFWVQAGGCDPIEWIYKLSGRVDCIHFKDMIIIDDKQEMSEVMEGNLNWNGIFKACSDTGVKWHIVEQDTCRRDPFDCLATSYNNLKKVGFK